MLYFKKLLLSAIGITNQTFYRMCKVLIEQWRWEYNTFRPHSSLGYLPPAPVTIEPMPSVSATLQLTVKKKYPVNRLL